MILGLHAAPTCLSPFIITYALFLSLNHFKRYYFSEIMNKFTEEMKSLSFSDEAAPKTDK